MMTSSLFKVYVFYRFQTEGKLEKCALWMVWTMSTHAEVQLKSLTMVIYYYIKLGRA